MGYQNDIFISYKRNAETLQWIKKHFYPLLEVRVELELGRRPNIYLDDQIESGTSWPLELARAISDSKILIPLWTKTYFNSKWCTQELSHMLGRERLTGCRTLSRPYGLIVPAVIHDGDAFPPELSAIQRFEIQDYFNPRMVRDGELAEKLATILYREARAIATTIENVPPWDEGWRNLATDEFFNAFYQDKPATQTLPTYR